MCGYIEQNCTAVPC